jgi:hypothetical protein
MGVNLVICVFLNELASLRLVTPRIFCVFGYVKA